MRSGTGLIVYVCKGDVREQMLGRLIDGVTCVCENSRQIKLLPFVEL